jgi:hypothetical protein
MLTTEQPFRHLHGDCKAETSLSRTTAIEEFPSSFSRRYCCLISGPLVSNFADACWLFGSCGMWRSYGSFKGLWSLHLQG